MYASTLCGRQEPVQCIYSHEGAPYYFLNPPQNQAAGFFVSSAIFELISSDFDKFLKFYVGGRVASLDVPGTPERRYISVYSPIDVKPFQKNDSAKALYSTLKRIVKEGPKKTYVLGDFNLTLLV